MSANNSRVEFFVGEEVPLRDDVESKVLFNQEGFITTNTFDVKIKREELGTDIEISSFINEDGTITMDLEAEISFPQYGISSIGVVNSITGAVVPFPLDGVDRSKLTSIITAASGQTIAIGGIIRERLEEYEKKVPLLGDLPFFGFFFKEVNDKRAKVETVILVTPHVITHPALAGRASRDFLERRSSHPRITRGQETLLDYPTVESTTGISTPPEPDARPENAPAEQR
jgi:type II secretory pathway component GspD/PulD (secretin)